MTQIYVTVNEYGEVYTSSKILGIRGEANARELVFDAPVHQNCTYEIWFNAGSGNVYASAITNGKCTVPTSVLTSEEIALQWVAVSGTEIMAKSKIWNMKVLFGLDDDNLPIPTYEDAVTMLGQIRAENQAALDRLNNVVPTSGAKNSVLVKNSASTNSASWQSLSALARATAFGQVFVIDWYDQPTDAQKEDAISAIKSYVAAAFPKHLLVKIRLDNANSYLPLSSFTVRGNIVYLVFVGHIHNYETIATTRIISLNIATDEYSQQGYNRWNYLTSNQVAQLSNFCTEAKVRNIVTSMLDEITDADEVSY